MKKKIRFILRWVMVLFVLWCSYQTTMVINKSIQPTALQMPIMIFGVLGYLGIGLLIIVGVAKALEWIWSDK